MYLKKLILILFFISCTNNNKNNNSWEIKYFADKNNQLTENGYLTNSKPIIGTFSNSIHNNAPLKVKIMVKERDVGIKLFENNINSPIKGSKQNPIEYKMSIEHNHKSIDFIFKGFNEYDVIIIGDIISSSHQTTLINLLKAGGIYNFQLETIENKNVYNFEIDNSLENTFLEQYNFLFKKS